MLIGKTTYWRRSRRSNRSFREEQVFMTDHATVREHLTKVYADRL